MTLAWWWLVPVLLLMVLLGALGLTADSIWGDEYFSLYDAGAATFGPLTPPEIWQRLAERNPWHTPGYFILLSGWGRLVGWSVFSARVLSLLVGVLAVAWTYRLGRDMVSPRVGLYAAVVLATSAYFVHFLHEIRMYTLFVLVAAFVLWVYLRIVTAGRVAWWLWPALFGGVLAMLYTHYFATLPLGALGLYHLWLGWRRQLSWRRWWTVVIVIGCAGLLFLPWFSQLWRSVQRATGSTELNPAANMLDTLHLMRLGLAKFSSGWVVPVGLAALLAGVIAWRRRAATLRRVWFLTLAILLTFFIINVVTDITHEGRLRYMMATFPLLAVLTGLGIAALTTLSGRRWLAPLALVAWVLFGVWSNASGLIRDTMDGTLQFYPMHIARDGLRDIGQPGDMVIHYLPDLLDPWRYGGVVNFYFEPLRMDFRVLETEHRESWQREQTRETLRDLQTVERVWTAAMHDLPTTTLPDFQAALLSDGGYQQCTTIDYRDTIDLTLFARHDVCCWTEHDADQPPLATFGDDVTLVGMEPLPDTVTDSLPVWLGWHLSESAPPNTYSVALHVENDAGDLVAQADDGMAYQQFACAPTVLDVSGLAPGEYTLRVTVYRWQDGSRLIGTHGPTEQRGDRLALGTFRVED